MEWLLLIPGIAAYGVGVIVTSGFAAKAWPPPRKYMKDGYTTTDRYDDWLVGVWVASIAWPIGLWIALGSIMMQRQQGLPTSPDPDYIKRLEEEVKEIEKATKKLRS